jgi:hypothetical protein
MFNCWWTKPSAIGVPSLFEWPKTKNLVSDRKPHLHFVLKLLSISIYLLVLHLQQIESLKCNLFKNSCKHKSGYHCIWNYIDKILTENRTHMEYERPPDSKSVWKYTCNWCQGGVTIVAPAVILMLNNLNSKYARYTE